MKTGNWFIVLSPDGAAREVGERTIAAFKKKLGSEKVGVFDTRIYREAYRKLLKAPTDEMVTDLLNQSLAVSCLDFRTTHCLVLSLCPVTLFTLNLLRTQGITTLHWFYEDFRRAAYWREVIGGYDHFCAVQYGPLPQASAESGREFHFLPTACMAEGPVKEAERRYDIAFIGVPSPYRISVLEKLAHCGYSLVCGGEGWGDYRGILQKSIIVKGWISPETAQQYLAQARIGINLSFSEPDSEHPDATAGREHNQVSPRAYDILASGAMLLTEYTPLLVDSLAGCRWHDFRTVQEAIEKTEEILATYPSLKNEIDFNRQAISERHTFMNRVLRILDIC